MPLAARIRAEGFTVCLSGEGADELFGGYGNMCIRSARLDEAGWRDLKVYQLEKMARGNFVRCNKAFMAGGVECRLPFLDRRVVESAVNWDRAGSPPGKRALKEAARPLLPGWAIRRRKETFQGAGGAAAAAAKIFDSPARAYNRYARAQFGHIPRA